MIDTQIINRVEERFLRYVKIDTQSDHSSETFPSTAKQFDLLHLLAKELTEIGMQQVELDENAYLTATLQANTKKDIPVIGFLAHVDTSPDMSGTNVQPQIIENYNGEKFTMGNESSTVFNPADFPDILKYVGKRIITSDGNTLLGADDKAGIAEIVTAMDYLIQHPEIEHGTLKICFTPDEEIGKGVDKFNVMKFGADFAYTLDGGEIGSLEFENFNAASAKITITGRNVHPGAAKNKMLNSLTIATELNEILPPAQRPEHTSGYEGFYHLVSISGTVEETTMEYIIRDHDKKKFQSKKAFLLQIVNLLNSKYESNCIEIELKDQYYNMCEMIEPKMYIVELADKAFKEAGIERLKTPIRGGTDGARLSFMGLPCPNIFAGGHNFHSRYEFVPVKSLQKAVEVIVRIVMLATEK